MEEQNTQKTSKDILKSIKKIEIKTSHIVNNYFAGEYHSIFKGRGMEFDEVREYSAFDDIRAMDWKVSARYGRPFVKRFKEERELTVFVMADISASNDYSSVLKLKKELVVELASVFAFSAMKNNDKVGLILFTDGIDKFVPPRKGRNHILHIIKEMIEHQRHGKKTDLANALFYFNKIQKRRSILILITDYLSDIPKREIEIASRSHDIIACIVSDKHEKYLENMGIISVIDPETNESIFIDTSSKSIRNKYNNNMKKYIENKISFFRRHNIDTLEITTEDDYIKSLMAFFKKRAR